MDIIHTGQHYSKTLDEVFFDQLRLPAPSVNLGVGSGTHGSQTAEMIAEIESYILENEPSIVFVQGDTNSALAGALASSKLTVPVAHIEAGLRSFDREMPEETNRVLIDHVSEHLFAPTTVAAEQLRNEGRPESSITVTGNTIADALLRYRDVASDRSDILADVGVEPGEFCLLTAHRAENVDDIERFESLLDGVNRYAIQTGLDVVYPIHPRARKHLRQSEIPVPETIRLVEPLEFFDFLRLESTASLIFTDSGGVQEEACILGTPCVTLRYTTERPETVHAGANCLSGLEPDDIVTAGQRMASKAGEWSSPFGDGTASTQILDALELPAQQPATPAARPSPST